MVNVVHWFILLIPFVSSVSTTMTQTIHTQKSVVNKFPGSPRTLNEGNTANNNIVSNIPSAPVLAVATVGIASGLNEYSISGDTSSALNAVAKGVTSSTAFYACQGGASNAISLVSPVAAIPTGYVAGMVCAYGSNYLYDSIFGVSSSSSNDVISNNDKLNDDILFSETELNFIIEALSDDNEKKSVKFNDIEYIYDTYHKTEYDRTSIRIDNNSNDNVDNIGNNDFINITSENTKSNESNNSKIHEYRNKLRYITSSKRKISEEYKYNFNTYSEFIEINKKNPNSVHPDIVKKYYTKVSNLKDEYNRLKRISNELISLIIHETELDDEFKKLNLSENIVLQQ